MSRWRWAIIALDIFIALCGIYCLNIGEKVGVAMTIGMLMLDACIGNMRGGKNEND